MKNTLKITFCLMAGFALALAAASPDPGLCEEEIRAAYYKSYGYEKTQSYEDSIKAITPVLTAYPQGYTVNLRLGWLYYLSGNFANAKTYYQSAIRIAPASIEAKLGYTLPLLAQERYDEVETMAREILRVDDSNYYANLRLVYALRLQKKLDAAETVLNRLLPLYPTDVKFLTEFGLVKQAQNQPVAARRVFADVLILDPENVVAKAQLQALAKNDAPKK